MIERENYDLLDELHQAKWQQRQHRRLMNLPVGHPDEPDDEGESDEDRN